MRFQQVTCGTQGDTRQRNGLHGIAHWPGVMPRLTKAQQQQDRQQRQQPVQAVMHQPEANQKGPGDQHQPRQQGDRRK